MSQAKTITKRVSTTPVKVEEQKTAAPSTSRTSHAKLAEGGELTVKLKRRRKTRGMKIVVE